MFVRRILALTVLILVGAIGFAGLRMSSTPFPIAAGFVGGLAALIFFGNKVQAKSLHEFGLGLALALPFIGLAFFGVATSESNWNVPLVTGAIFGCGLLSRSMHRWLRESLAPTKQQIAAPPTK